VKILHPADRVLCARQSGHRARPREIIARQDFDDRSYPTGCDFQVAFLDAHPEVGVVGGTTSSLTRIVAKRYVRMTPTEHGRVIRPWQRASRWQTPLPRSVRACGSKPAAIPSSSTSRISSSGSGSRSWGGTSQPARVVGEHFVIPRAFSPHVQVCRPPAKPGPRAGAVCPRAPAAKLDVPLRHGRRYGYAYCPRS